MSVSHCRKDIIKNNINNKLNSRVLIANAHIKMGSNSYEKVKTFNT